MPPSKSDQVILAKADELIGPRGISRRRFIGAGALAAWLEPEGPSPSESKTSSRGVFDVVEYGATLNGATDDYPALAAAITAATVGGGVVVVPAGSLRCNTAIAFPADVSLVMRAGGRLRPANGIIMTLPASFHAEAMQCFDLSLGGTCVWAINAVVLEARPEWWGAVPDGVTNCTAAIVACEAALPGIDGNGYGMGTIRFSAGKYGITNWTLLERHNLRIIGAGHFATALWGLAGGGATAVVNLTNASRHHWENLNIDANRQRASAMTIKGANVGDILFTNVRLTGATVDTLRIGDGVHDDIAHLKFIGCSIRSNAASNSNIYIDSGNAVGNSFIGCQIGGGAGSPYNVYCVAGQTDFYSCYFSGATTVDFNMVSGQAAVHGGRSESVSFWLSSLTDALSWESGVSVISAVGICTSGAKSIVHKSPRTLMLLGVFSNGDIEVTAGSQIVANGCRFKPNKGFIQTGAGRVVGQTLNAQSDISIAVAHQHPQSVFSVSVPDNVATTLFDAATLLAGGDHMLVSCGDGNSFVSLFVVGMSGNGTPYVLTLASTSGAGYGISVVGTTIKLTQTSGSTLTVTGSGLRIGKL